MVPTLPVEMGIPLWYCVTAFTLLFMVLLRMRARLEHQRARVERCIWPRNRDEDAVGRVDPPLKPRIPGSSRGSPG